MQAIRRLNEQFSKLLLFVSLIAGALTFVMMCLIDANALSRKVFNMQVPGAVELTQSLLTVVIMLPFAYVLYRGEHVGTAFLTSKFSPQVNRWLRFFWMVVGCFVFACVFYGTFDFAIRSFQNNEQVWGASVRFPLYPAKFAIAIGSFLLAIQFAIEALLLAFTKPGSETPRQAGPQEILDV